MTGGHGRRPDAQGDPAVQAMIAGDNAAVLALTEGVTDRPPSPAEARLWHVRAYMRVVALISVGREDDALVQSTAFLQHAEKVGGYAELFALAATVWPQYLAGRDSEALRRLDEVIVRAEAVADPARRMQALVAAASISGWIGVTEVSDDLLTRVNSMVDVAPPGVIGGGLRRSLRDARVAARLYLALTCELEGSARSRELYAGIGPLVGRTELDLGRIGPIPPQIERFFASTRGFALAALGASELPAPARAGPPMPVPPPGQSFDVVGAAAEVIDGLARLRVTESRGDLVALRGTDRLESLARRARLIAMEAEACRMSLRAAQGTGDRAEIAARQERFEAAVAQLDWKRRLQNVHSHVFRARLLASVG